MNNFKFPQLRDDRKGMMVAAACFVHCVLGPLLLSVAGAGSLIGLSERFEPIFLLSTVTFGLATLIPAYRRKHGQLSCLSLFAGGLVCLLMRGHLRFGILPESAASGAGAILIFGAHALNSRLLRRCPCCDASAPQKEPNQRPG